MTKPNDREQELASVIRSNLVEMAGKVKPRHVASERHVQKAMGTSWTENAIHPPHDAAATPRVTENNTTANSMKEQQPMEVN